MSDWITIEGVRPYDGRYEFDIDGQPLTTREWGWIKRHADYFPLTLRGAAFADPEFVSVLAVIALRRAGKIETREVPGLLERLWDAPFGATVTIETDPADLEEDDADGPPARSSASRPSSNGADSMTGSGSSENHPSPTGAPSSDTSASAPATSVS